MSEKICMFCEHLKYDTGGGYEYADPSQLSCSKGHFDKMGGGKTFVYDLSDFRRLIVRAADCPDYKQVKP
jgi:hypothetical protein